MNILGRNKELKRIEAIAVSEPENKAIFGVKGIGKSIIIESVFSKANCRQYAKEYHYLYVRTILDSKTKGDELIVFLYDRVINAIDLIEDQDVVFTIQQRIEESNNRYKSKDGLLRDVLETIREFDYSMILIMDDFHNMGRNTDVGSEQYDFLRSLNELGLMYYWIISDSDFSDVYATSQFTTSFFAQKFIPETMPQMRKDDMLELISYNSSRFGVEINEEDANKICDLIGGIPGFVVPAVKCYELLDSKITNTDEFVELMFENPQCKSILTSWTRSLTKEQKDILTDIAINRKLYQDQCSGIIGKINQLGDNSGLGLIIHDSDDAGRYWCINSRLFSDYILKRTDEFYSNDIINAVSDIQLETQPITYIQNNYYTVNNNFFDAGNAFQALVNLKSLVESNAANSDNSLIEAAVKQLPYQQPEWNDLEEEQKDERMDEYADKVFESESFCAEGLSESQMTRFHLSTELLDSMPDLCRKNLISAIQVYDLIQFCVDKFGLDMHDSEAARGILFARAYESLLKYSLKPALDSVNAIANKTIILERNTYLFANAPVNKMTIGNFVFILNDDKSLKSLADVCVNELGSVNYDCKWWKNHETAMFNISNLRNDCCHSGTLFDEKKLEKLLKFLFDIDTISTVTLYNDITNRNSAK